MSSRWQGLSKLLPKNYDIICIKFIYLLNKSLGFQQISKVTMGINLVIQKKKLI